MRVKTTFISMISSTLAALFNQQVVWAPHGTEALDSGIDMITDVLENATPEVRHLIVRLPGAYDGKQGSLVLKVDERRTHRTSDFKNAKCFLITTGTSKATFANEYGPLHALLIRTGLSSTRRKGWTHVKIW